MCLMVRYDALVAGGGLAGLSAALVLGRTRRETLVCGAGPTRNAPTSHAHNFVSRDGIAPGELIQISRDQIGAYPSVHFSDDWVTSGEAAEGGFVLTLRSGEQVFARKVVIATGIADGLPEIEGLAERWGKSVLHCPFCDAWEHRDQAWALYGQEASVYELCVMARAWTDRVTLCTGGPSPLSDEQHARLAANGIAVKETPISRVEGKGTNLERIVFADGSELACQALFVRTERTQRSDLAARLGCELTETGLIQVDEMGRTTTPGVYAAGDAITPLQILPFAAYSGARAGVVAAKTLFEEDFV